MGKFSVNETGKVEFFGMTTAEPDFLTKHDITYAEKGDSADLMVQTRPHSTPALYLLEGLDQQLRLITLAQLQHDYAPLASQLPPALKKAITARTQAAAGALLYQAHYEDSRAGLIHVAYDAAIIAGVTHATARWFGYYFVQDAFLGYGMDQEFTERGVFRGPKAFSVAHATVKKQLFQLQLAGLLRYEAVAKQGGFYVRFNRLSFPGLSLEKFPDFFSCLLY